MRSLLLIGLATFSSLFSNAQTKSEKIKLFVDCSNTFCDMSYLKTEINLVDFILDNKAADVHLLITEQRAGSGGSHYQLIFFGQNNYKNLKDTLQFNTDPNSTDFETRKLLSKYVQFGLIPFIARTDVAKFATIELKQSADSKEMAPIAATKDKWNYWVFRVSGNGNLNADKIYKGIRYSSNLSANRVTDKRKVSFNLSGSKNITTYEFESLSGVSKYEVKNENYSFYHQLVNSINEHWSYGYDAQASRSTFSNYKLQTSFTPAIEYNFFPYKEVNNKLLTVKYGLDVIHNNYIDTTLYNKTKETLFGQGLSVSLSYNQKWGTTYFGLNYHNYLHNFEYYNLGMSSSVNVRITGGLTFNVFLFGGLVRDQLYLPKGDVTEQEVLTRRRQLASAYNYYTSFGISYRFGSKLNNFVNPRFEGGGGNMFFN
ncbi:MAG: hypothetical protein ABIN57_10095 [Chitinophagaceae bacterium]